jgi:Holliday junction DNA helicase RuvA
VIGRLTGVLVSEEADGTFVLDAGGVGYEVSAPLGTVGRARALATAADELTFFIHTHVREDALSLFGFATAEDKAAFRALIAVSNVGPKMALALLSAMTADELAHAVASKDLARLVAVPGIGKKTAERLLLELAGKLAPAPKTMKTPGRAEPPRPTSGPTPSELLASALVRLGYRPNEADRAIAQLGTRVDSEPVQTLVREALALLAR